MGSNVLSQSTTALIQTPQSHGKTLSTENNKRLPPVPMNQMIISKSVEINPSLHSKRKKSKRIKRKISHSVQNSIEYESETNERYKHNKKNNKSVGSGFNQRFKRNKHKTHKSDALLS